MERRHVLEEEHQREAREQEPHTLGVNDKPKTSSPFERSCYPKEPTCDWPARDRDPYPCYKQKHPVQNDHRYPFPRDLRRLKFK